MFTRKMFHLGLFIVALIVSSCATPAAPSPSPVASLKPATANVTSIPATPTLPPTLPSSPLPTSASIATMTEVIQFTPAIPTGSAQSGIPATPTLLPTLPSSPLPTLTSIVTMTEVIQFTPAIPTGPAQSGSCWENSVAVSRDGAWRCTMGNDIADPCFAVGEKPTIVCGADPSANEAGFIVNLTEPLPKSYIPAQARQAYRGWLIRLTDGTVCGFATGATTVVNGERANYLCTDRSVILGDLKPGRVWTAQKAVISVGANGPQLDKGPETVAIRTVWQ